MPYSQPEEHKALAILDALKPLLGDEQVKLHARKGGGNSLVWCVNTKDKQYAVKSYPPFAPGKRDRLAAEVQVYEFLNGHQVPALPRLIQYSETDRLLVMEWIDGEIPEHYGDQDIEQAIHFLANVVQLNAKADAAQLPLAAEACLSLNIIIEQVNQRLQRLQTAASNEPALQDFLKQEFIPLFETCREQALSGYYHHGLNPDALLPETERSLIPADFGFHNSLRDTHGRLHFFDFDYFGWDDPVKLLADILWHPKMHLTEAQVKHFIHGITQVFHYDKNFVTRFQYTYPLFGLRWVLILLNEFIPEFWQNRQHAEVHSSLAAAKVNQLKRAKEMLLNVQKIGSAYELTAETSL